MVYNITIYVQGVICVAKTVKEYGNESITQLKGPDQVRLRPAVIFGSDGLDGCEHSVFEIISNSIDEAREGYGKKIIINNVGFEIRQGEILTLIGPNGTGKSTLLKIIAGKEDYQGKILYQKEFSIFLL